MSVTLDVVVGIRHVKRVAETGRRRQKAREALFRHGGLYGLLDMLSMAMPLVGLQGSGPWEHRKRKPRP